MKPTVALCDQSIYHIILLVSLECDIISRRSDLSANIAFYKQTGYVQVGRKLSVMWIDVLLFKLDTVRIDFILIN